MHTHTPQQADSDEDALRDEEEEAVRLQAGRAARLDDADFGLGDDGLGAPLVAAAADAKDGKAAAAKEAKEGPAKEAKKAKKGLEVEAVERDLSALGTGARGGMGADSQPRCEMRAAPPCCRVATGLAWNRP